MIVFARFSRTSKAAMLWLVAAAVVFGHRPVAAGELTADVEVALFLKVLSFEYSVKNQPGTKIVIGVVNNGGARSRQILDAFNYLAKKRDVRIHGKRVVALSIKVTELEQRAELAAAFYSAPDVSAEAVGKLARQLKRPSFAGNRAAVVKGVAIGVIAEGRRPGILINVKAARAAKLKFDPKLLRLAKLLK